MRIVVLSAIACSRPMDGTGRHSEANEAIFPLNPPAGEFITAEAIIPDGQFSKGQLSDTLGTTFLKNANLKNRY